MKQSNDHQHVTETPDVAHIRNVGVTHELSDVDIKGILLFVAGLSALTVVVFVLILLMFNYLEKENIESAPPPMAMTEEERMPPEPRLQGAPGFAGELARSTSEEPRDSKKPKDPLWEIRVLRKQWDETLTHGVKDENGKIIVLPIEEAKSKLLRETVVPVRPNPPAEIPGMRLEYYGIDIPTAASSGRMTEKRRE